MFSWNRNCILVSLHSRYISMLQNTPFFGKEYFNIHNSHFLAFIIRKFACISSFILLLEIMTVPKLSEFVG
jgi:hypothetical protein